MMHPVSEAMVARAARAIKEPLWRSDHNDRTDEELQALAHAALVAALSVECATMGARWSPWRAMRRGGPGWFAGRGVMYESNGPWTRIYWRRHWGPFAKVLARFDCWRLNRGEADRG